MTTVIAAHSWLISTWIRSGVPALAISLRTIVRAGPGAVRSTLRALADGDGLSDTAG